MSAVIEEVAPRLMYRELRSNAQQIIDENVKERVLAGIELLNQRYGPGWVDHVDPNKLLLESGNHCVLGQLYGTYEDGLERLGMNRYSYSHGGPYGFWADDPEDEGTPWVELTEAWKVALGA